MYNGKAIRWRAAATWVEPLLNDRPRAPPSSDGGKVVNERVRNPQCFRSMCILILLAYDHREASVKGGTGKRQRVTASMSSAVVHTSSTHFAMQIPVQFEDRAVALSASSNLPERHTTSLADYTALVMRIRQIDRSIENSRQLLQIYDRMAQQVADEARLLGMKLTTRYS